MQTDHWLHYHGTPNITAELKSRPEDFIVKELLTFEPLGEGEHCLIWLKKTGLNTAFVAEQLAKFAQLPLRNVSYAGRKDKFAVTEQWFSLHMPGKAEPDWSTFNLPGAEILRRERHHKKLRPGNLDSNQFQITLRNLSHTEGLEARLAQIEKLGVPNYYGSQRFGEIRLQPETDDSSQTTKRRGGNLELAQKMLEGESIRNRNKRSMAISALRSWLFNEFVHGRIHYARHNNQSIHEAISGDILMLAGSNSFFHCETPDAMIQSRLKEQDIQLSAPLWGKGELGSTGEALAFESSIAEQHPEQCEMLEALGLKQERRPLWLYPLKLNWELSGNNLTLQFYLPPGCFATSILRELVITD
ncbi:tRNA pseudouridine(13) synthase TruD [Alteromonas sp. a30]|uniref:tRNA pseudouridine(13) synthase TruD n=1 Tax=Alteromonas sp. a30 TaxID=2730917 RepID=UPI003FA379D3|nr:tRNA pseudouridine(13) synthase TruD [Alteromonas sp. a30]